MSLGAVAALPGVARAGDRNDPVVRTSHGPVRGRVEDGVLAFRGIRYGAPPIGNRRFKPPQAPAPWTEVADAGAFGAASIQSAGEAQ
jgi:para-nitrobenzyl esterase